MSLFIGDQNCMSFFVVFNLHTGLQTSISLDIFFKITESLEKLFQHDFFLLNKTHPESSKLKFYQTFS